MYEDTTLEQITYDMQKGSAATGMADSSYRLAEVQ